MKDLEREKKEGRGYSPLHKDDPRHIVRHTIGGWDNGEGSGGGGGIPPRALHLLKAQGTAPQDPALAHPAAHPIPHLVEKVLEKNGDEGGLNGRLTRWLF